MEVFCRASIALFVFALVFGTLLYSSQSNLNRYSVRYQFHINSYPTSSSISDSIGAAKRFMRRLQVLHKNCPNYEHSRLRQSWVPTPHLLVDVSRHLLVCVVPKSGSSTWHGTIWALRRKRAGLSLDQKYYEAKDTVENHAMSRNISVKDGLKLARYLPGDDDLFRAPTPGQRHRVILARHPFARLISGWNDKFKKESNYWPKLFQRYPLLRNYNKTSPTLTHVLSFKDFSNYVAEHGKNVVFLDYHFKPASYICKPCEYAYTYVAKSESVDRDQTWLRERLNISDLPVVRRGVSTNGYSVFKSDPSDKIESMFSSLDSEVIKKLFLVYRQDFLAFGYTFNFKTLKSGGFD